MWRSFIVPLISVLASCGVRAKSRSAISFIFLFWYFLFVESDGLLSRRISRHAKALRMAHKQIDKHVNGENRFALRRLCSGVKDEFHPVAPDQDKDIIPASEHAEVRPRQRGSRNRWIITHSPAFHY